MPTDEFPKFDPEKLFQEQRQLEERFEAILSFMPERDRLIMWGSVEKQRDKIMASNERGSVKMSKYVELLRTTIQLLEGNSLPKA